MSLKFCANLNFLFTENGAGFLEKYYLAKAAGFNGVESGFPSQVALSDILKAKTETGLEHVLLNISTDGSEDMKFGCAAFPNAKDQFKKNLEITVNTAKALGCRKIHVMAGKCVNPPTDDYLETYLENLKYAAKIFEKENLTGLIEPINKYAVPGYFLNNYDTAIDILNKVGSSKLKLLLDIYHLQHIRGNVTNTLNELSSYIGHIQIAQVPHRHEPSEPGELDFCYLFKEIEKVGYTDWIGCEYTPKITTSEGLGWVKSFGYSL